jgi:hypothetical protein
MEHVVGDGKKVFYCTCRNAQICWGGKKEKRAQNVARTLVTPLTLQLKCIEVNTNTKYQHEKEK